MKYIWCDTVNIISNQIYLVWYWAKKHRNFFFRDFIYFLKFEFETCSMKPFLNWCPYISYSTISHTTTNSYPSISFSNFFFLLLLQLFLIQLLLQVFILLWIHFSSYPIIADASTFNQTSSYATISYPTTFNKIIS